jgi:hypothetical protein
VTRLLVAKSPEGSRLLSVVCPPDADLVRTSGTLGPVRSRTPLVLGLVV